MINPREVVAEVRRAESTASTYDRIEGVRCPMCGEVLPANGSGVRKTRAWEGGLRERYHTCPLCEWGFKSVES